MDRYMTAAADALDAYTRTGWALLGIGVVAAFILGCVAYWLSGSVAPEGYDEPPTAEDEWALKACIARHPAGKDPVRLEQMAAIRDAEEAFDRDIWGKGWTYVSGECTACGKDKCACRWSA